jgi:hypothetical protein
MMKMTRNRKNRTLAIVAEPRARPVKPKRAATIEIRKKVNAHFSMYAPILGRARVRAAHALKGADATGVAFRGEGRNCAELVGDLDHRVAASVVAHEREQRGGV